jgi:hypothetical protein
MLIFRSTFCFRPTDYTNLQSTCKNKLISLVGAANNKPVSARCPTTTRDHVVACHSSFLLLIIIVMLYVHFELHRVFIFISAVAIRGSYSSSAQRDDQRGIFPSGCLSTGIVVPALVTRARDSTLSGQNVFRYAGGVVESGGFGWWCSRDSH